MNLDYLSHIFSTKTGASLSSYIMDFEHMACCQTASCHHHQAHQKIQTRSESQTFPTFTGSSRKAAG